MKEKSKVLIWGTIFTCLYLGYAIICFLGVFEAVPLIIIGTIILIVSICMVVVTKERLNEIKEEEKNDISKY